MYNLETLQRGLRNPRLALNEINSLFYRKFNKSNVNNHGVDIFDEEWDTLIILDACRYDMFEILHDLPGRLESRSSKGSSTGEFLEANFKRRTLHDTVYTTSNPQLRRHWDRIEPDLHDVIDVWEEEGWDAEEETVLPETMTESALRSIERYPNKRHIVHYMQPHYPFVGTNSNIGRGHLSNKDSEIDNVWWQIMKGELDPVESQIRRKYYQNLNRALPHVEELIAAIDGRTVITADHGNLLGERGFPIPIRTWGHPRGVYSPELVTVPWLVIESGTRRSISSESPHANVTDVDRQVVNDRLNQLGYTDV